MTSGSRIAWIEPDGIVYSILEALLTAQVPLCGFDGNVSQEKLDLFELTASLMAQSGTCPAQVMRGEPCQTAADGSLLYDGPDHFRREAVSPHSLRLVDGSKQRPDVIAASAAHSSTDLFTQSGIGTVRM